MPGCSSWENPQPMVWNIDHYHLIGENGAAMGLTEDRIVGRWPYIAMDPNHGLPEIYFHNEDLLTIEVNRVGPQFRVDYTPPVGPAPIYIQNYPDAESMPTDEEIIAAVRRWWDENFGL